MDGVCSALETDIMSLRRGSRLTPIPCVVMKWTESGGARAAGLKGKSIGQTNVTSTSVVKGAGKSNLLVNNLSSKQ